MTSSITPFQRLAARSTIALVCFGTSLAFGIGVVHAQSQPSVLTAPQPAPLAVPQQPPAATPGAPFAPSPTQAVSAPAGGIGSVVDRLERLERDIQALNVQMARGVPAASAISQPELTASELEGPAAARMAVRLNALEVDLRNATGSMEQMSFQIRQLTSRFDKLVADLDYRLSRLDGGAPLSAGQPVATVAPASGPLGQPAVTSPVDGLSTQGLPPVAGTQPAVGSVAGQPGVTTTVTTTSNLSPGQQSLGTISQAQSDGASQVVANTPVPEAQAVAQRGQTAAFVQPAQSLVAPPVNQPQPVATVTETAGPLPAGSPRDQYAHAFRLLRQADYDQAQVALEAFLEAHPQDNLAANAKYWLGETHYVRGSYVKAAEVFLEGFKEHPQGNKAPDTLLKLGMSLTALEKKEQACATFSKLGRDYPDAPTSILDTVKRERAKADCP